MLKFQPLEHHVSRLSGALGGQQWARDNLERVQAQSAQGMLDGEVWARVEKEEGESSVPPTTICPNDTVRHSSGGRTAFTKTGLQLPASTLSVGRL